MLFFFVVSFVLPPIEAMMYLRQDEYRRKILDPQADQLHTCEIVPVPDAMFARSRHGSALPLPSAGGRFFA